MSYIIQRYDRTTRSWREWEDNIYSTLRAAEYRVREWEQAMPEDSFRWSVLQPLVD